MSGKVLSSRDFTELADPNEGPWETYIRRERWRRDQLAAVTFGIEVRGIGIMLEGDWDRIAQSIDPSLGTCHPLLDEFFRARFSPMTTSWIHDHPELDRIGRVFDHYRAVMSRHFSFDSPRYRDLVKKKF